MPLLELKGLTMRFGGLTAVNKVDFAVEKGQVFSVIGPNGAGKTTVFNAVTGVYEPTEGRILFDGREIRRPFRARVAAAMVLVGLLTGFGLAAFSANVDQLWRSVVVLNTPDPGEPFPARKALGDLWTYLHAGLLVEADDYRLADLEVGRKAGMHVVRSKVTKAVLEEHDDPEKARRRREVLTDLQALLGSTRTAIPGGGRWIVVAEGEIVGMHADEAAARRQSQDLRDLPEAAVEERPDGKTLLVKDGRVLGTFGQRFLAEDFRSEMSWAAGAAAESAAGKWLVLDGGGRRALAVFPGREAARAWLLKLAIDSGKLRWKVTTRASAAALGTASSPEEGRRLAEVLEARLGSDPALAGVARARRAAALLVWISFFGGLAIGAGGTYAVWSRSRRTTDLIARSGLGRTFQNIRLFPEMLSLENILMGMDAKRRVGLAAMALHTPGHRAGEEAARAKALELLEFVGLKGRERMLAKNLPYGDQRRLEIARALATDPVLLLLDEPAAGMNPAESVELTKLIAKIRDRGVTILLIEHHMKVVMGISDRIAVLDYGTKIAEGTPAEIRANPRVIEAYLGKEEVT